MNKNTVIDTLHAIRNSYTHESASKKLKLLNQLTITTLKSKAQTTLLYDTLLFILAHPHHEEIYQTADQKLNELIEHIATHSGLKRLLYNSGITGSEICTQISFELAKWLRINFRNNVSLDSFGADDSKITYIISAVLPQIESEIMQDENRSCKEWLKHCTLKHEDQLDTLIRIFDQSEIRPEIKDELWNSLEIFITVQLTGRIQLPPQSGVKDFHNLKDKINLPRERNTFKHKKINISINHAKAILVTARMMLVSHSREIDPISFSAPDLVSYYELQGGFTIALFGMQSERRHPIDSYMGYMVFKNGLPLAYGGSWILFNSARIALHVFPSYRGGKSRYTFEQILELHREVFHVNRFSVDPYQIGKNNDDGIKSGSFWMFYKAGFRPIKGELLELAESEFRKINSDRNYRTPFSVLKQLANGRMELMLSKNAVRFDATDLSLKYSEIVTMYFNGDRRVAEDQCYQQLCKLLQISSNSVNGNLKYVIKNWCVLFFNHNSTLKQQPQLLKKLKLIFQSKANGDEYFYIKMLQQSAEIGAIIAGEVKK